MAFDSRRSSPKLRNVPHQLSGTPRKIAYLLASRVKSFTSHTFGDCLRNPSKYQDMVKSKRTKKFEKKHLKDAIQRRKEHAKIKQKRQIQTQRKARRDDQKKPAENGEHESGKSTAPQTVNKFGEMSVDEFFSGGFDLADEPKSNGKKATASVTKKRKRDSESPNGQDERPHLDSIESDEGSQASVEDHKQQLDNLANFDPEFYKYLVDNAAGLLDFEGDEGPPGIEQLAGSEDEAEEESGRSQGEKGESALENELDISMVKKWQTAMTEKHSLRSAKELVLAFRAAAHSDDETSPRHKYSLTDPDGL